MKKMNKYFIISDFEGLGGVVNWKETGRKEDYIFFREVQIQELSQMIKTITSYDPEAQIWIRDYHADMRNILYSKLQGKNIRLIRGSLSNSVGLEFDSTFKGLILHGFHAKSATEGAVLPHTFSTKIRVFLNDTEIGETGMLAAVSSGRGVPVLLLTGDKAVCREFKELSPETEFVEVKEGFSPMCAVCKSMDMVLEEIDLALKKALSKDFKVKPIFYPPYRLQVTFSTPAIALLASFIPGVKKDGLNIHFASENLEDIYKLMIIIYILLSEEKSL